MAIVATRCESLIFMCETQFNKGQRCTAIYYEAEKNKFSKATLYFPQKMAQAQIFCKSIIKRNGCNLQVLRHRQSLARFARRRARRSKKKWALKYDELYYNGQIFVFDENSNRVVAKSRA